MKSITTVFCLGVCCSLAAGEVMTDSLNRLPDAARWNLAIASENGAAWTLDEDVLTATAADKKSGMILLREAPSDNYSVEAQFRFLPGKPKHVGLVFRGAAPKMRDKLYFTGFIFNIYADRVSLQMVDPTWRTLKSVKLAAPMDEIWHSFKVEAVDEEIRCFLDGRLLIEEASGKFESGVPGLRIASGSAARFRDFKVEVIKEK